MTDLLIRDVKQDVYDWLKAEAAEHGRSLSEEAKLVLARELKRPEGFRIGQKPKGEQSDD